MPESRKGQDSGESWKRQHAIRQHIKLFVNYDLARDLAAAVQPGGEVHHMRHKRRLTFTNRVKSTGG